MILAFGELMLRLSPPGRLRLEQALPGQLEATFAGAEANVCVSLARYGQRVRYLTALPVGPLAQAAKGELTRHGIDTNHVVHLPRGRLGVFYVETGANQRGSQVVYDRESSAISLAGPADYPWEAALAGVRWLHLSGIMPALSQSAFEATLTLAQLAAQRGVTVSCDLNFRQKLWRWRPPTAARDLAGECLAQILQHVQVLVANEEDAADVLGIHARGTRIDQGQIDAGAYADVAAQIAERFGRLRTIAFTLRESISADFNRWGGLLYDVRTRQAVLAPLDSAGQYAPYEIRNIVDRVGAGDAFAAGLIHGLCGLAGGGTVVDGGAESGAAALAFAVAAGCLKHSIAGDFNLVTAEEVQAVIQGRTRGRVQR